jgi:prepilin-type processing-associated H-X9-DG protein
VLEKAKQRSCQSNLKQLGIGLSLYQDELGDDQFYPDTNGAGFLARLHQCETITEWKIYICPSTNDSNDEGRDLENILAEDPVGTNACSYAGRRNKNADAYPGIYAKMKDTSDTPTASDDFDQPAITALNHENLAIFLFLDGHVEDVRQENSQFLEFRDPLTN